ncbi:Protein of unknown function [Pyronema omphalodes CBS 100304]|uniref:Uncharacterized protein n=1 Tax=Pyronema omphalodes (strain CBS 100304) TaxID=1076935 RepID=U4LA53_PYROM|nr:Protein of unknown function [Pyronema omphalodes CBS 100304]
MYYDVGFTGCAYTTPTKTNYLGRAGECHILSKKIAHGCRETNRAQMSSATKGKQNEQESVRIINRGVAGEYVSLEL